MFIFNIYNILKYKTYYLAFYDSHCTKFPFSFCQNRNKLVPFPCLEGKKSSTGRLPKQTS